jgi:membrane associated rhomboid family serine protease
MGIHDREYYRDETSESVNGSPWTMVTKLIVVTSAIYVLDFVGNSHWLMENLALTEESLKKPYLWWQLLTYGFAHSPQDHMHIFWNMVVLWVFGRQIEDLYGPKEFLRIYLAAMLFGGLVWAIRSQFDEHPGMVIGASGAVTAITLLFCIHFPKQTILLMMVIPVPAWFLGAAIILGDLFRLRFSQENIAFDVHLAGAAFAVAYYKLGWNFGRWWPNFSFPVRRLNPFSNRPKLRVHRPRDEAVDDFEQLEAQADHLLEKVNRDGVDSLTARERQVLEDYSRRMRNKRR